jgi:hypothetical protein
MPEDRGRGAKFCSPECRRGNYFATVRRAGAQMTLATYRALLAARRAEALEQKGLTCVQCGVKFLRLDRWRGNFRGMSTRYCSLACRDAACTERRCLVCDEPFTPRRDADAKICDTNACRAAFRRQRMRAALGPRACPNCGAVFSPTKPEGRFCSSGCSNQWRFRAAAE